MGACEAYLDAFSDRELVGFGYRLPHFGCGFVKEGSCRVPRCFGFADYSLGCCVSTQDAGCALDGFSFGQVDGEVEGRSCNAQRDRSKTRGEHWCGVNHVEGGGFGRRFFLTVRAFGWNKQVFGLEAQTRCAAETTDEPLVDDFDLRLGDEQDPHLFGCGAVVFVYWGKSGYPSGVGNATAEVPSSGQEVSVVGFDGFCA